MKRQTEMYPWAWIAHHRLQWGPNWRYIAKKYLNKGEDK